MKPRPIVVIIDGDKGTRRLLRQVLQPQAYRVFEGEKAQEGLENVVRLRPDVVILDLDLPDLDGLTLLGRLREWSRVPVLVLSARNQEEQKVAALDAGANDFMTKPFGSDELLARLRVLQRAVPWITDGPRLVEGGVSINLASHEVQFNGRQIKFTPTEEALFFILVRYAGKVVTRNHLTRSLWGFEGENKIRDLRVYIGTLRKKLENQSQNIMIHTEGSTGYKLQVLNGADQQHNPELARLTTA